MEKEKERKREEREEEGRRKEGVATSVIFHAENVRILIYFHFSLFLTS